MLVVIHKCKPVFNIILMNPFHCSIVSLENSSQEPSMEFTYKLLHTLSHQLE
jgi:hypothetical protein